MTRDGVLAVQQSCLPRRNYYLSMLTAGLLPYQAARVLWLDAWATQVERESGIVSGASGPIPQSPTMLFAAQRFLYTALIASGLAAAVAGLALALACYRGTPRLGIRARQRALVARGAVKLAIIIVPLLHLVIAYGLYDRTNLWGPPMPDGTGLLHSAAASLCSGIVLGVFLRARIAVSGFSRRGQCGKCGYDLPGAAAEVCSECGTKGPLGAPGFLFYHRVLKRRAQLALAAFAVILLLMVCRAPLDVLTIRSTTLGTPGAIEFAVRWISLGMSNAEYHTFGGFMGEYHRGDNGAFHFHLAK